MTIVGLSDYLVRNPDVRRITYVYITPDTITELFSFKPKVSGTIGEFLSELTLNSTQSSLVLVENDLGVLSYSLSNELDFLLPKLTIQKDRLISQGGAILSKEGKFVPWMDDEELISGARLIRGLYRRGNVSVVCPVTNVKWMKNISRKSISTSRKPLRKK